MHCFGLRRIGTLRPFLVAILFGCASIVCPSVSQAATPFFDMEEVVSGGSNFDGIFTCGLNSSGGIKCWGVNDSGQLGDSSLTASTVPVTVTGLASGALQVAAGRAHACAVVSGGAVKCWGKNTYGQLGDNSTTTRNSPVDVSGLSSGVSRVFAGSEHSCALKTNGALVCWGRNQTSQLSGTGASTCAGENCSLVPLTVYGSGVLDAAAGSYHTCAVVTGGAATCWGNNYYGQLGNNSTSDSASPVSVTGLSSGVTQITAGNVHSCALNSDGEVLCWGANGAYELGYESVSVCDGGMIDCSKVPDYVTESGGSNVSSIAQISTSPLGSHNCAVTLTGGARCWGSNINQELGNTASDDCLAGVNNCSKSPITVHDNGSGIVHISAGDDYSCAVTSSGSIRCWETATIFRLIRSVSMITFRFPATLL